MIAQAFGSRFYRQKSRLIPPVANLVRAQLRLLSPACGRTPLRFHASVSLSRTHPRPPTALSHSRAHLMPPAAVSHFRAKPRSPAASHYCAQLRSLAPSTFHANLRILANAHAIKASRTRISHLCER